MKPFVILFALTIIQTVCQAQIDFQPGYYIRNDGSRISCLIKDYGWLKNPTSIHCKSAPEASAVTIGMDSIIEFGVGGAKYQRYDVDVETSGTTTDDLSHTPIPSFRHMTVMLKVLVDGQASLYVYTGKRVSRFFYRLNRTLPAPLIFKEYVDQNGGIHVNQEFIRVLADSLSCAASDMPDPLSVRYDAKSLARFFIAYNTCEKSPYSDYYATSAKTIFHLNIRAGADRAKFVLSDHTGQVPQSFSYGNSTGFRIGVEAELILPFNRNKWGVLIEPAFRTFSSSPSAGYAVDYKALQVFVAGRYFLFTGSQSKLYLTAGIFTNFNTGSTIQYEGVNLFIQPRLGEMIAGGFRYRDRFAIELQYQFPQSTLNNYIYIGSTLTTASLVVSCKIL
jgi:hypothetical protein